MTYSTPLLPDKPEFHMALLNTIQAVVIVLDGGGRVIFLNDYGEKSLGYTLSEIRGREIWEKLLTDKDAEAVASAFKYLSADWFPNQSDYLIRTKDGRERIYQFTQTIITADTGAIYYVVCTGYDITKTRHEMQALQSRLMDYETIVETMHGALLVFDEKGAVVYVNEQFCQLIGISRTALLNVFVAELVAADARPSFQLQLERAREGSSHVFELQLAGHKNRIVNVLFNMTPIFSASNHFRGCFALVTDISTYKQSEAAFIETDAELDAFASTVAHDLKEPLAVLTGFATLIQHDRLGLSEAQIDEYLQIIAHTGAKMINIIDELLLLSQMRHLETVPMHPLDMGVIIHEALLRLQFMIEQYGAQIVLPDAPWPLAYGYGPWVEEVWVNYISNAIKYGGKPPRIELGATVDADNDHVCFWVRDNGRGISPDALQQVFTPFTRLDHLRAKGHGLGLSIVQRIVTKLGGSVSVDSQSGAGSTFKFSLPASHGGTNNQ